MVCRHDLDSHCAACHTLLSLEAVQDALDSWKQDNEKEEPWMKQFRTYGCRGFMKANMA